MNETQPTQNQKQFKVDPPKPIDRDMSNPILKNDIELTADQIALLESRVTKCFLCKWILEDYRAHGTLTGHKSDDGQFEIFPLRGELNHLNLEFKGTPYPWKEPVNELESKPHAFTKGEKLVPVEPIVAPTPRPDQSKKDEQSGPAITIKQDPNAVPVSKPKLKPGGNIRL